MNTTVILLALMPLVVWRIYARIRRLLVRQRSALWRHWAVAIVLPLALLATAVQAAGNPLALAGLFAAAAVGAGLGQWGLKLTRFESTAQGFFYTPNARLGVTVAMLFVARLLYRLIEVYEIYYQGMRQAPSDFAATPLTTLPLGLLAGYFGAYAIGLLRWRRNAPPLSVVR